MNDAFERAAQSSMRDILAITMEPLVSCDFKGDPHSVVIDGQLTGMCGNTLGKAFGWYDNEWGYSCRLKDFLVQSA
jgi:glyceraldehyde 3-phosphate dehydrogenase